jgi:two-component system sensor histidine kinase RegB
MPAAKDEGLLHLETLVRLRWGAVAAQAAVLGAVFLLAPSDVALPLAACVVIANALANGALLYASKHVARVGRAALVGILVADVAILTLLLAVTGGPFNPFTFLYLVEVTLATVVVDGLGAFAVAATAAVAYGALFFSTDVSHHDHNHMV